MKKIITAILIFLIPAAAQAAGIGVTPTSLTVNQLSSDTTEAALYVHNTGDNPAIYEVYSEQWPQLVYPDVPKFRLEPGNSRQVSITWDRLPPGQHSFNLAVTGQDVGMGLDLPKTGFKVPVNLNIEAGAYESYNIYALIVGLLLLSLILLILSLIRHYRRSTLAKIRDAAQETLASRSTKAMIKHDLKHHTLMVVSIIAMLIAGILLVWSFTATSTSLTDSRSAIEEASSSVSLTLITPDDNKLYSVRSAGSLSAFTALQQASAQYGFSLKYDPPGEMGVFVTEINGFENGEDGKYWVYEVNGEKSPIAADKHSLVNNDSLVWKFVIPE